MCGAIEREQAYCLLRNGSRRSPGTSRKAGKVIRLKTPNTTTPPRMAEERREDRFYSRSRRMLVSPARPAHDIACMAGILTGAARMRSISTRDQATTAVSIAFENVCIW